jgi:putative ABC transport system permease protein
MWKNKWMVLCLLVGNILLVGIVAATPMYNTATLRRVLHRDLRQAQAENQKHPAMLTLRYDFNLIGEENREIGYLQTRDNFVPGMLRDLGVPAEMTLRMDVLSSWHMVPAVPRENTPRIRSLELVGAEDFAERILLTQGHLPDNSLTEGYIIEALAMEGTLIRHDILLGELLEVRNLHRPLYIRIVGIYTPTEGAEQYWSALNITHLNSLLISPDVVRNEFLADYRADYRLLTTWIHLLDYTRMTGRRIPHYIETLERMDGRFNLPAQTWQFTQNFADVIAANADRSDRVELTLWVLQIPLYVLFAAYIYMVSRRILMMEQNEISVLKSRGASRRQLLGLYAMQGVAVALVCYPVGLAFGVFLCRMLGASTGFLLLVQRAALLVEITPQALLYGAVALFFSFLTMFLPVIAYSRVSIVEHKLNQSGKPKKALWQRFYLDILCLAVSSYGLYSFRNRQEIFHDDPLIFAGSSLFIMGLGLLCLRLFPYGVRLIFKMGRHFWRPAAYASMLKIIRSAGEEQFIMIFLIFTLSVGTFSAQAARTINANNDDQIRYLNGADVVFQEFWRASRPMPGTPGLTVFFEPDFTRFTQFPEVDSITQVKRQNVVVRMTNETRNAALMAIETDRFGNTVWFRNDLLGVHINHFLNVLASCADGVLLSEGFRDMGFRLWDTVTFTGENNNTARGVVTGFVSRWPGFNPAEQELLIVANLGYLQTAWGVQPYQVWMRTNTAYNGFFYDYAQQNRLWLLGLHDADAQVTESRNAPVLQGINGVLTVVFLIGLFICFAGFLIYWILSVRSRVLQFGVFRALGMQMRALVELLIYEQFLITFTSIALGVIVGEITARLFVPLVLLSYTASEQVLPPTVANEIGDYINMHITSGIMILICLMILAVYVSRLKITQALKLGED